MFKRLKQTIAYLIAIALMSTASYALPSAKTPIQALAFTSQSLSDVEHRRDYGTATAARFNDDAIRLSASYPTGEYAVLNRAIETWLRRTITNFQYPAVSGAGKLSIDYTSKRVADQFISVAMIGHYSADDGSQATDIVKTFNYHIATNRLLVLSDVVNSDLASALKRDIAHQLGIPSKFVGLNHWQMATDSLSFFYVGDEYLPLIVDAQHLSLTAPSFRASTLSYNALSEALVAKKTQGHKPVDVKKQIALTFDDGPSAYTSRLLKILEQNKAKATFFVVGNRLAKRADVAKSIVEQGHEIAGHSWNHSLFTRLSNQRVAQQINWTRNAIKRVTGVDSRLVRPPYGAVNRRVLGVAKRADVAFINWNIDTLDWKNRNADAVYRSIIGRVRGGDIILCHDIHRTTIDAMARVIPRLIADGYQLVTVSELLSSQQRQIRAGRLYYKR